MAVIRQVNDIISLLRELVKGAGQGLFGNAIFFDEQPVTAKPNDISIDTNNFIITQYNGGSWVEQELTHKSLQFNLNPTVTPTEGLLHWSDEYGTLVLGMPGGSEHELGVRIDVPKRPKNVSGGTINSGSIVYITGATGAVLNVDLAIASDADIARGTIAMCTVDGVGNNQRGVFTAFGDVGGLNTSSYPEGTKLYLSNTVAGGFTDTPPSNNIIEIGTVTRQHPSVGEIFVNIRPAVGLELDNIRSDYSSQFLLMGA